MHAHLLSASDDGHAGSVLRGFELTDHLRELRVRARGVDDQRASFVRGVSRARARARVEVRVGSRHDPRAHLLHHAPPVVVDGELPVLARPDLVGAPRDDGSDAGERPFSPSERRAQQTQRLTRTYDVLNERCGWLTSCGGCQERWVLGRCQWVPTRR